MPAPVVTQRVLGHRPATKASHLSLYIGTGAVVLILGGVAFAYLGFHHKNAGQANAPAPPDTAISSAAQPTSPAEGVLPDGQAPQIPDMSQQQANANQVGSNPSLSDAPVNQSPPSAGRPGATASAPARAPTSRQPVQSPVVQVPTPPPYQGAHQNARQAFFDGRYIDPPNDSAVYWARMARQEGDPEASAIESEALQRVVASVNAAREARNYDYALATVNRLMVLFPDHPELQRMGTSIQQEQQDYARQLEAKRKEEEIARQTKRFNLRHRHVVGLTYPPVYAYCEGTLTVVPNAIARFDCTHTNDPSGRCDHLVFKTGEVRELRPNKDGSMHLAAQSGRFDFYGDSGSIQELLTVLQTFVQK